jgi:sulfur-carrier protein
MSRVEVRYWAAAREAAGVECEAVEGEVLGAGSLAEVLSAVRLRHDERFGRILGSSSLLVDGVAVGHLDPGAVTLDDGATVEVLPPFAGG